MLHARVHWHVAACAVRVPGGVDKRCRADPVQADFTSSRRARRPSRREPDEHRQRPRPGLRAAAGPASMASSRGASTWSRSESSARSTSAARPDLLERPIIRHIEHHARYELFDVGARVTLHSRDGLFFLGTGLAKEWVRESGRGKSSCACANDYWGDRVHADLLRSTPRPVEQVRCSSSCTLASRCEGWARCRSTPRLWSGPARIPTTRLRPRNGEARDGCAIGPSTIVYDVHLRRTTEERPPCS